MVFSASPLFLSHVSYFFSQATSISVKWIFRCLLYLMSELYTCLTESIYPRLFSSWRSRRYSLNASSTVFGLTELETCSFKVLAVNNLSSDFSLTISVSYSFFLLAMSMLIYSLLGQFDFGMFFSKFQCSALTDTPKLLYFRLPSMQTQIIRGCSPLPRVFDL